MAGWFQAHAKPLATLDPNGPLDDLEPLGEMAQGARVLAIGENAHFVKEFTQARERVLRFLSERCGFTVFAFEFGFSEAFALDPWLQGKSDAELDPMVAAWGAGELMHWLRRHNTTSGHPCAWSASTCPRRAGRCDRRSIPSKRFSTTRSSTACSSSPTA